MLNKALDAADKILNWVMIIFCILLILIGGYAIYDSYRIYDDASLDDKILTLKPKNTGEFDLESLQEINPDIEGWLTMFETSIDYPVLHSNNNLDYLNQDYNGNYSTGGSIFSDYRNKFAFEDDYTILYGHNMVTGQMFSEIRSYENSDYFDRHLYGVLYTKDHAYKVEVIYFAKVNAYHDDIYNLTTYANHKNEELVNLLEKKATRVNHVVDFNKLLLLSTCDSYGSNDRTVLLARISDTNDQEIDTMAQNAEAMAEMNQPDKKGFRDVLGGRNIPSLFVIIVLIIIITVLAKRIYIDVKNNHKNS